MPGVLGEGPVDPFNPDLLRDEPTDKVGWAVVQQAAGRDELSKLARNAAA